MVASRTSTPLLGLLASVAIGATPWYYFDTFLLLLSVPFVPLLRRRADAGGRRDAARECPACGFRTVGRG